MGKLARMNAEQKKNEALQKIEHAKTSKRPMESLLFEACAKKDAALCREILNSGISATCTNPELFYSATYGDYIPRNRIEFEENGMYFECQRCERSRRTPIIECAMHGHESLVMEFIEWADSHDMSFLSLPHELCFKNFLYTSINDDGAGLWHFAAEKNMVKLAQKLKEQGISSDCMDGWGYTPLHFATPKMIPMIIECGGKKEKGGGEMGWTPLQYVVSCNSWERFSALLKAGCSVESITNGEELMDLEDERIINVLMRLRRDLF